MAMKRIECSLSEPPPAGVWIVTAKGQLAMICPNGCCMAMAHRSGEPVPAGGTWRCASDGEIEAGRHAVDWSVSNSAQLIDAEVWGNA